MTAYIQVKNCNAAVFKRDISSPCPLYLDTSCQGQQCCTNVAQLSFSCHLSSASTPQSGGGLPLPRALPVATRFNQALHFRFIFDTSACICICVSSSFHYAHVRHESLCDPILTFTHELIGTLKLSRIPQMPASPLPIMRHSFCPSDSWILRAPKRSVTNVVEACLASPEFLDCAVPISGIQNGVSSDVDEALRAHTGSMPCMSIPANLPSFYLYAANFQNLPSRSESHFEQ